MTTHPDPAASGEMSSRVAPSSTNRCRSPRRDTYGHAGSRPPGSRRPGEKRLIHGGTGRRPLLWHPGAVEPPSDRAADQAPPTGPSQRPTAASVMLHRSPHRWRPCPAQASPDQHLTTHMLLVSDGSLPLVHAEFRYRCVDPFAVQLRLSVGPIPGRQLDLHPGAVDRRNQPPPRYRRRPDIPGRRWCAHRTPISHRPARPCSERNELQCRLDGARANITHLNAQRVTDLFPDSQKDTRRNSAPPLPPPERSR